MVHRRKEIKVFHQDLLSPLRIQSKSKEMLQNIVCYRAVEESFAGLLASLAGLDPMKTF